MLTTALVVLAGAVLGGFVSGLAGFGTGLVTLGIWLHVVPPATAATLAAVCSVASQIQTLPAIWPAIDRARLWPFLAAGLLGVPIGTALLTHIDPPTFRVAMGAFLLVFTSVMLLAGTRPALTWGGRKADAVSGFLGGILGGLAGLSGPIPILWATLRGWPKHAGRAVFQPFNLVILLAAILAHAAAGFPANLALLTLCALPGTFTGAWLGTQAYRRLTDHHFQKIILGLLALSGLTLLWSGL